MAPDAAPESPQAAASAWVDAVMKRGDLGAAWPDTDPILRLVLAQDWVWNHRHDPAVGHDSDWDAIADGLAASPPDHPLWERFSDELVSSWQKTWKGFDPAAWPPRPQPEVLGLDLELVTFVEPGTGMERRFALRHTEAGWLVCGVNGDQLFEPGWPPRIGQAG